MHCPSICMSSWTTKAMLLYESSPTPSVMLELATARTLGVVHKLYEATMVEHPTLPPEIVQEIFHDCVAYDACDESDCSSSHSPARTPLLLTRIWSTWRQIVLDTSRLWMHFTLACDSHSNQSEMWRNKLSRPPWRLPVQKCIAQTAAGNH